MWPRLNPCSILKQQFRSSLRCLQLHGGLYVLYRPTWLPVCTGYSRLLQRDVLCQLLQVVTWWWWILNNNSSSRCRLNCLQVCRTPMSHTATMARVSCWRWNRNPDASWWFLQCFCSSWVHLSSPVQAAVWLWSITILHTATLLVFWLVYLYLFIHHLLLY